MDDDPKDERAPPSRNDARLDSSPPRRRLDGVIPELLKRAVEIGLDKAHDAPESLKHLVSDLRLPKEVATYLLTQVEDTKNGALRVVAKETRDFLEHANLASELKKVLTTLQFEINTTIRFRPAEAKTESDEDGDDDEDSSTLPKPEVKLDVFARRHERKKKSKEG